MIREAIKAEMERAGWRQVEVAKRIGSTQPDLCCYLAGKRDWTGEKLDRVLTVLGLTVCRERGPRSIR